MKKIFLILTCILAFSPHFAFAADVSCGTAAAVCSCTDENDVSVPLSNATLTDSSACLSACISQNAVSYALFCGGSSTPVDSDDIAPDLESASTTTKLDDPSVPSLNVPLPTLSEQELADSLTVDSDGNIVTNMIGVYVNAVFSYALVIASLFGVLMFMLSGFQYMTAGGDSGAVAKAKGRMQNTIFGLIILMATYSIAFLLDPRTTRFNSLTLQNVAAIEAFPPEGEDIDITPNPSLGGDSYILEGNYLIPGGSDLSIDGDTLLALQDAAEDFYTTYGQQIYISSAKRDLTKQATLFYNNCLRKGGVCSPITCNPASSAVIAKSGSRYSLVGELAGVTDASTIISSMVTHAAPGNCPHTSAVAVDLWCNDGGGNYQHDPVCQDALIKTMINNGFCRLSAEAWHFEYNAKKVSTKCLTSNNSVTYTTKSGTYTPSSDCGRWDFKNNKCVLTR
jgi:Type IV secretion system pilin